MEKWKLGVDILILREYISLIMTRYIPVVKHAGGIVHLESQRPITASAAQGSYVWNLIDRGGTGE